MALDPRLTGTAKEGSIVNRLEEMARHGRFRMRAALALSSVLFLGNPAAAAVTITPISGTFNAPQENGCTLVSAFFYKVDCSYARGSNGSGGPVVPWIGPTEAAVYYRAGSPHADPSYSPQPDDDRTSLALTGEVTVDDQDTADPGDDLVSAVLVVASAARSILVSPAAGHLVRAVESWDRVTHTMAPTRISSAAPNAAGGTDYVIGARGLPERICRKVEPDRCFPIADAPLVTDGRWGAGVWAAPATIPIGRGTLFGGNPGAATTQVIEGYRCIDRAGGSGCDNGVGLWGRQKGNGLANLLLRVSTDGNMRIVMLHGFWTYEYRIEAGPPIARGPAGETNSWLGGYIDARQDDQGMPPNGRLRDLGREAVTIGQVLQH